MNEIVEIKRVYGQTNKITIIKKVSVEEISDVYICEGLVINNYKSNSGNIYKVVFIKSHSGNLLAYGIVDKEISLNRLDDVLYTADEVIDKLVSGKWEYGGFIKAIAQ